MPLSHRAIAVVAAAGLAWLPESPAHACSSASSCAQSVFLPASGSIPANAVEFLWRPAWSQPAQAAAVPHLYKLENGQRSELAVEILEGFDGLKRVRPTQAFVPGTTLVLESVEPACTIAQSMPAQLTVREASALPSALGTIQVAETRARTTLHIPTSSGVCSDDFEVASARLTLTLDAAAQPFADALRHALLVDGRKRVQPQVTPPRGQWTSFSLAGRLDDVLYTLCTRPSDGWTNDIPPGSHRVQWLATLPDGSELRSDEINLELRCGQAGDASVDAATDASADPAGEASVDARVDAGAPQQAPTPPAPSTPIAVPDAEEDAEPTAGAESSHAARAPDASAASCTLRSARAGVTTSWWSATFVLSLLLACVGLRARSRARRVAIGARSAPPGRPHSTR